jgi:hypothetical protein
LAVYLWDDPAPALEEELLESGSRQPTEWRPAPVGDPDWARVAAPAHLDDLTFTWNRGPWLGMGQPSQYRSVKVFSKAMGSRNGGVKILRLEGCATDHLWQWLRADPGVTYRASALFRGRVSPSDEEYLMVSFLDRKNSYVGETLQSRVPLGNWFRPRQLRVLGMAPSEAKQVGVALYTVHQAPGDWAEFWGLRVERN